MKRIITLTLLLLVVFGLVFANNGNGPGDGISDGPDDGAGYGSPGNGQGDGPGGGKLDSGERTVALPAVRPIFEKSEPLFLTLLKEFIIMMRNAFKSFNFSGVAMLQIGGR